ncbi:MAG TPA: hypothetical protein VGX23_06370 [Actinocrinis sp.]|nr:hypothetical protein [Actinocrinis sp.]
MARYEGPAQLEWWANGMTCLVSYDVRVQISFDDDGWKSTAEFTARPTDAEEDFWAMTKDDPYFVLRFAHGRYSTITVKVDETEDGNTLILSEPPKR